MSSGTIKVGMVPFIVKVWCDEWHFREEPVLNSFDHD